MSKVLKKGDDKDIFLEMNWQVFNSLKKEKTRRV